jgi:septal ring factor EnvC (AmiA/AmiB activator)
LFRRAKGRIVSANSDHFFWLGKEGFMRPAYWAAVLAFSLVSTAYAQDVRQPSDWKKMYDDASAQLRASQNRKAELAAENAGLQTQLRKAQLAIDTFDERTRLLNAVYAGWESFIQRNPAIFEQWRAFWGQDIPALSDDAGPILFDPQWPFTSP